MTNFTKTLKAMSQCLRISCLYIAEPKRMQTNFQIYLRNTESKPVKMITIPNLRQNVHGCV